MNIHSLLSIPALLDGLCIGFTFYQVLMEPFDAIYHQSASVSFNVIYFVDHFDDIAILAVVKDKCYTLLLIFCLLPFR